MVVADPLSASSQSGQRPLAMRHAAVALIAASVVAVMLLTSGQMSDLRVALPQLSRTMSWLEGLPVPLDMDHVAFFAVVALGLRLLLPGVRWWWLLLGLCGLGVITELLQFATIGRTPKLLDARDDVIGSVIGLLLGSLPLWCSAQAKGMIRLSGVLLLAGIALLPIQQWPLASAFGFPLLPSDTLFVLSLAVRAFALATGNASLRVTGFHGWLAAYVFAGLMAVLVLPRELFAQGLTKCVGIVWLATMAALACDAAADAGQRRSLVEAWLLGAALAALASWLAILGFYAGEAFGVMVTPLLSHYGSLPPGPYPRVVGLFANANMAGLFLLLSVAIGLAAHAVRWFSTRRLHAFLLLLSLPLLATASQAVGATVFLLAWWWFCRSGIARARRLATLGVGTAAAIAILALLLVNPASPFLEPSVRMQLWHQAWLTWQGAFWRGIGLGQPAASLDYMAPDGHVQHLTDAHNIALNLGVQGGAVALAAFVGLVAWSWRQSRHHAALSIPRTALLLAVGYLGIGGSFEDARILWVFIGMLAGTGIACRVPQTSRASLT